MHCECILPLLLCSLLYSTVRGHQSGSDTATVSSNYTEDLTIQRVGGNHVAARFVFKSQWEPQDKHRCQDHEDWPENSPYDGTALRGDKLCHFEAVFPRAVGVLLDRYKARRNGSYPPVWLQIPSSLHFE